MEFDDPYLDENPYAMCPHPAARPVPTPVRPGLLQLRSSQDAQVLRSPSPAPSSATLQLEPLSRRATVDDYLSAVSEESLSEIATRQ